MAQILILNDSIGATCYDQDNRHVGCCNMHNVAMPTHQIVIPNLWLSSSDTSSNLNLNCTRNINYTNTDKTHGVADLMFMRALHAAEESNRNNNNNNNTNTNKSVILLLPYTDGSSSNTSSGVGNSSNSSNSSSGGSSCCNTDTNKETSIFLDGAHYKDKGDTLPINDSLWLIDSTTNHLSNVQLRYNPRESVNGVIMPCPSNTNNGSGNSTSVKREVENYANSNLSSNRWIYHNPNTPTNLNHSCRSEHFSQPIVSNSLEMADVLKDGISWQLKPHPQTPTRYVMLANTLQKYGDDLSSNSEWNHLNLPQLQPIYTTREREKENEKEKEKEQRNNGGQEIMGGNPEKHPCMEKDITVSNNTSQDKMSITYVGPTTISTGHQVIKRYCHLNDKKYMCMVCGKKYKYETNLITHAKVHTEQALECEYCHKKFGRKTNYIEHLRIHTNERPYKCRYCGKSFKQNHGWRDHERTHTNERPHVCDICGKGFAVGHNLTVHKRIHTGEKPYACDHCDKRFRQKSAYNAHIKNVHKNEKRKINK